MTSIDDSQAPSTSGRDTAGATNQGLRPRGVFGKLPRYAAGKPPVVVEGLESFKLSSNENPLPPLPAVLEAIASETSVNRYPDPMTTALRTELAGYLGVPATDIVTGAGDLGALNQILATFAGQNDFDAPDEVVYAWRSFEAYPISVGLAGAAGVQVPVRPDGTHDLDAMAAAITDRTRVVMLCTPNNPTGPVLTRDDVVAFLEKVPAHIVVVIDEAYQEFVRRSDAVDGIELYREYENVIVLRTFSKAHGLAGARRILRVPAGPDRAPPRQRRSLRGLPDRRTRGRDVPAPHRRGRGARAEHRRRAHPGGRGPSGPGVDHPGGRGELRLARPGRAHPGLRRPGRRACPVRPCLRVRGGSGLDRRGGREHPFPRAVQRLPAPSSGTLTPS